MSKIIRGWESSIWRGDGDEDQVGDLDTLEGGRERRITITHGSYPTDQKLSQAVAGLSKIEQACIMSYRRRIPWGMWGDLEMMEAEEFSFYNCGSKIYITADPCRTIFMEVPFGALHGKNTIPDTIRVRVEHCTNDQGSKTLKNIEKRERSERCYQFLHWQHPSGSGGDADAQRVRAAWNVWPDGQKSRDVWQRSGIWPLVRRGWVERIEVQKRAYIYIYIYMCEKGFSIKCPTRVDMPRKSTKS